MNSRDHASPLDVTLHKNWACQWQIGNTGIWLGRSIDYRNQWIITSDEDKEWLSRHQLNDQLFPTRTAAYRAALAALHIDQPDNTAWMPVALIKQDDEHWITTDKRWRVKQYRVAAGERAGELRYLLQSTQNHDAPAQAVCRTLREAAIDIRCWDDAHT